MSATKIDGIPWTWNGSSKPYGGYITNISINVGLGGNATTASLTLVSEDGNYAMPGPNVDRCGGQIGRLDISFLGISFDMYAAGFSIQQGAAGTIGTVDLIDASIDYFEKVLIINKKYKPTRGGLVEGVAFLGEEYYNDPSSSKGELIKRKDMLQTTAGDIDIGDTAEGERSYKNPFLASKALKEFGSWLWTPKELANEISGMGVPLSPAAYGLLASYDKLFFTDSGNLGSILGKMGSTFGTVFYFDPFTKQIDILTPSAVPFNVPSTAGLVSYKFTKDRSMTQVVSQVGRVALAAGDPGNPEYAVPLDTRPFSPIFGKVQGAGGKIQLFKPSKIRSDSEPVVDKSNFQALNLLKAFALGPEFAVVYILVKLAVLGDSKWPAGEAP